MMTGSSPHPRFALRSRSITGLPTPLPSAMIWHRPASSLDRVTSRTRSTTAGYGVPSATRSRYRSRSLTSFRNAKTSASPFPVNSALSSTAMAVGSWTCPRSTPPKNQLALMALSNVQRFYFVGHRPSPRVAVEYAAHRIRELAQVFLLEPPFSHRLPLLFQKLRWNPRAFVCRHADALPFRPPVLPCFVEESTLPVGRAHQPQLPPAHRQHGPDRQVQIVAHPRRFVHQQQRHGRKASDRALRAGQSHDPRPVRKRQRYLVVAVPLWPDPQALREYRRLAHEFAALPRRRAYHQRQALRMGIRFMNRLRRGYCGLAPLPRAVQQPARRAARQHLRLPVVRFEPQLVSRPFVGSAFFVGSGLLARDDAFWRHQPGRSPAGSPARSTFAVVFLVGFPHPNPNAARLRVDEVEVLLQVETRGAAHCDEVVRQLRQAGYTLIFT